MNSNNTDRVDAVAKKKVIQRKAKKFLDPSTDTVNVRSKTNIISTPLTTNESPQISSNQTSSPVISRNTNSSQSQAPISRNINSSQSQASISRNTNSSQSQASISRNTNSSQSQAPVSSRQEFSTTSLNDNDSNCAGIRFEYDHKGTIVNLSSN